MAFSDNPDILHCVLLHLVDADDTLVPFTGVARYSGVSQAWRAACSAPLLWKQAHTVLLGQAIALQRTSPDPKAPRRPRTPYQLWAEQHDVRQLHDREHERWDTWVAAERTLVLKWRALGAPERRIWTTAAREDQLRFQVEHEQYKPWLLPDDNEDDTMLGCRRLAAHLHAERRRPDRWTPTTRQPSDPDRVGDVGVEVSTAQAGDNDDWQTLMEAFAIA